MREVDESETGTMATVRILVAKAMMDNFYAEDGLKERVKSSYNCKVKFISSSPECVATIKGPLGQNLYSCISFLVPWLYGCEDGLDDGLEKDLRFLMHKSLSLEVIGEGANTIKNIKLASGAKVIVHSKDAPHSTDRVVQVTGNLLEVIDATKLIYEAIADVQVQDKAEFYNPSKHDEFNVPDYGGFSTEFKLKMKRTKQPSKVTSEEPKEEEPDEKIIKENIGFHDMELDERIQKSIAKIGWAKPTLIQEKGIPLLLDGKDILARGRTGSGKTGTFAIPMLQRILNVKNELDGSGSQCVRGVVLCPSRELAKQTAMALTQLASHSTGIIRILDVGAKEVDVVKPLLKNLPDILVSTPGRLATHIREGNVDLKKSLEFLVIDEADLVFTFGFEKDIKYILENLPKIYQACLTSATLSDDVEKLKKLVLNNPVVLKLLESDLPGESVLTQYVLKLENQEKYTLIYALFKLQIIRGKTIIFVSTVDRCYRLKLYLEQFAISSCVLNSELPAASRCHMVTEFNSGAFEVLIAADEKLLEEESNLNKKGKPKKIDYSRLKSKRRKDMESGVARGIDFQFVSNVINYDFPKSYESYIHRVGRTARAGYNGTALSLVSAAEHIFFEAVEDKMAQTGGGALTPYQFNMNELEGLKYRATSAWNMASRNAVREARLKEIKNELKNSEKLKAYFEDNPADKNLISHVQKAEHIPGQRHMKNVPDYLIPSSLRHSGVTVSRKKANFQQPRPNRNSVMAKRRAADPLQFGMAEKRKRF